MTKNQKIREDRYHELLNRRIYLVDRLAEVNREIKAIEAERAYENKLTWKLKSILFRK